MRSETMAWTSLRPCRAACVVVATIPVWTTSISAADVAVTADVNAPAAFILAPGRTAGWQFAVGAPLLVTDVGLYDWQGDGFQIGYTLGLWNDRGDLLVSATVPSGTVASLEGGFRYAGLESGVILTPDEIYTIAYFAASIAPNDHALHFGDWHTMHPLLQQIGGAVITSQPGPAMAMPDSPFPGFDYWFGPSFQFQIVPAPGDVAIVLGVVLMQHRRRRDVR